MEFKNPKDPASVAATVLELEGQALIACAERLRTEPQKSEFKKAIDLIQKSLSVGGKVIVTGIGKSGKVGQKIAATLSSTGCPAFYIHPTEALHGDLGFVQKLDVVLALSYSGNTEELSRILPFFKKLGTPLIAVSGKSDSTLTKESLAWLDASVETEACPHNLTPTTSSTLALGIGDAIAISLMELRGFKKDDFAQNHPGGSLGRRLNLLVKDVMHSGKSVPLVAQSASMQDVIDLSTEHKLGGVLVHNSYILLGIITDGDIRRALKKGESFFKLSAKDVMTANPITVNEEQMAYEALALMEDRNSQISVLPVLDSQQKIKGLLRLHDLVQVF